MDGDIGLHTVENTAYENSGKIGLLRKVQTIWNQWGIRIGGPRLRGVGHGSDGGEGLRRRAGPDFG